MGTAPSPLKLMRWGVLLASSEMVSVPFCRVCADGVKVTMIWHFENALGSGCTTLPELQSGGVPLPGVCWNWLLLNVIVPI